MIIRNNDYEVQASYTLYLFFYFLAIMFIYVTDLLKKNRTIFTGYFYC